MIGALLVLLLQVSAPEAVPATTTPATAAVTETVTTPAAPAPSNRAGAMDCHYDRAANVRNCTTAEGEQLRCRRQQRVGTRFYDWTCLTLAQDEALQRESQEALDRQQRITTPDRN